MVDVGFVAVSTSESRFCSTQYWLIRVRANVAIAGSVPVCVARMFYIDWEKEIEKELLGFVFHHWFVRIGAHINNYSLETLYFLEYMSLKV